MCYLPKRFSQVILARAMFVSLPTSINKRAHHLWSARKQLNFLLNQQELRDLGENSKWPSLQHIFLRVVCRPSFYTLWGGGDVLQQVVWGHWVPRLLSGAEAEKTEGQAGFPRGCLKRSTPLSLKAEKWPQDGQESSLWGCPKQVHQWSVPVRTQE